VERDEAINVDELLGKISRTQDSQEVQDILEDIGISPDKQFKDWLELSSEVEKAATRKAKQQTVTPAATIGATGKAITTGDTREDLTKQLEDLMRKPKTRENMIARKRILNKLEGLR
jgi:hypothetical protein